MSEPESVTIKTMAVPSYHERGKLLLGALVDLAACRDDGIVEFQFDVSAAKINGGDLQPCVLVTIGDLAQPFITHELRKLCDFLERTADRPDMAYITGIAPLFVMSALKAIDAADEWFAREHPNAKRH